MFTIIVDTLDNNINSSVSQKTNNSHYFCDFKNLNYSLLRHSLNSLFSDNLYKYTCSWIKCYINKRLINGMFQKMQT